MDTRTDKQDTSQQNATVVLDDVSKGKQPSGSAGSDGGKSPTEEQKQNKINNSIFVDDTDNFNVTIWYSMNGSQMDVFDAKPQEIAAGSAEPQSLTVTFRYPDFGTAQQILQASTTYESMGVPTLDFLKIRQNVLHGLIKSWDAKDKDGKPVPVTPASVSKLRSAMANALIDRAQEIIGATGLKII